MLYNLTKILKDTAKKIWYSEKKCNSETAVERLCALFAKSWLEMIDDLADKKFTLLKLDGYYTDYK